MQKNRKVKLFNIEVDVLSMNETLEVINEAVIAKKQVVHNCINANKVVLMEKDKLLHNSLVQADIISADGQAIVWSSKLFNKPLPERVPGIDLMENLMTLAVEQGYKVYLFGAKQEIVEKVAMHYGDTINSDLIAGYRNGYFSEDDELKIVEDINNSGAQILFVAIPSPQKELFINKYRAKMPNIYLLMGVGGSFDVIAGSVPRAPRWMQNVGLEWFYRLIQEPKKMWRRYLIGNFIFLFLTIKYRVQIGK